MSTRSAALSRFPSPFHFFPSIPAFRPSPFFFCWYLPAPVTATPNSLGLGCPGNGAHTRNRGVASFKLKEGIRKGGSSGKEGKVRSFSSSRVGYGAAFHLLKEDEKRSCLFAGIGTLGRAAKSPQCRISLSHVSRVNVFRRPLRSSPPSQGQPKVGRLSARLIGRRQLGPNRGSQVAPIRSLSGRGVGVPSTRSRSSVS